MLLNGFQILCLLFFCIKINKIHTNKMKIKQKYEEKESKESLYF